MYRPGNYIQYPVINYNGKNIKKNVYMYNCHSIVHQTLRTIEIRGNQFNSVQSLSLL